MLPLPFVVQPQSLKIPVGDTRSGILEFQSFGGLLVEEQVFVDAAISDLPTPFTAAARLATKVSQGEGVDLLAAFNIVTGELADVDIAVYQLVRIKYAEDIQSLSLISEKVSIARKIATVTALIRSRLSKGWTEQNTRELSARLFEFIWQFAQSELTDGVDEGQNFAPTIDDVVKQPGV